MNPDTQNESSEPAFDGLFSAIVPCKNESEMIPIFYEEFLRVMQTISAKNFELIFVDDGSTDSTLDEIKKLSQTDARIRYISLSRNFGKEAAMFAGFEAAEGEYIAVLDADLQDPPELLPEMFNLIKDCDCVATRRSTRAKEPLARSLFAKLFYKVLNSISSLKFREGARDFRLMRRNVLSELLRLGEFNRFTKGFYEWVGFKTKWLDYENKPRVAGTTKWSLLGLARYSADAISSFSTIPLAIVAVLGVGCCILSAFAIVFVAIRQLLFHNSVSGWASLVCILCFLSGLQLFCLGVMGHYISKIYLETKKRPIYIVRERN